MAFLIVFTFFTNAFSIPFVFFTYWREAFDVFPFPPITHTPIRNFKPFRDVMIFFKFSAYYTHSARHDYVLLIFRLYPV